MGKDYYALNEFRINAITSLSENFCVDIKVAQKILEYLETEDLIKITAPEIVDKPATFFSKDKQLSRTDLSMTSHKMGNILINTHLEWRSLAEFIVSTIMTLSGVTIANPLLLITGLCSCVLSLSNLTDIKISENSTAIIISLQKHSAYMEYSMSIQDCMDEANEILELYKYDKMDRLTFERELAILRAIGSIDVIDERIKLIETVIFYYNI